MINYISKLIFIRTLILGTLISISSSSWFGIWIGLEINLISFIPLIINIKNLISTESAIKYFLTQTFASLIFLFTSIIYILKYNILFNYSPFINENIIINRTIILKLGAAPFHFWLPNIIDGLSWINSLILLTWQKLAPLIILSYSIFNWIIFFFIILSTCIGRIRGLNQTSLRKILAFSSINHIGWLISAIFLSNILWMTYYLIYLIINISIIRIFKTLNTFNINQIFLSSNNSPLIKFCFIINFLSLGGLPPFLGFLPKWIIIENLIKINSFFILFFIIIITLITLFFYLRISFTGLLITYPSYPWLKTKTPNPSVNLNLIFNMIIIFSLLIILLNNYYII